MDNQQHKRRTKADEDLEREIRQARKFTLAEAIGRLAGPGALKGESPVARMQQAAFEIESWLRRHLAEAGGPLEVVLARRLKASELLLNNFDQPLVVLASYFQRVLESDYLLSDLVREADVEWGRQMEERPHFETYGVPPRPDDPYTLESVRKTLFSLLDQLAIDLTST
jgi:hypothetical protein